MKAANTKANIKVKAFNINFGPQHPAAERVHWLKSVYLEKRQT
jgi:NADH:ubiquinone oxidoreductase subunit D